MTPLEENEKNKIQELMLKAAQLAERQQQIQKEILALRVALNNLKPSDVPQIEIKTTQEGKKPDPPKLAEAPPVRSPIKPSVSEPTKAVSSAKKEKTPLEEFIGANLLNKIGIAILVLGIGYGVKYSIDHDLLNPLNRIILGYISGGILIGIALKLKPWYATFSAVLLSGGMAALYFITYAAYDFYGFLPLAMAFALMVLFTAFTVYAAIQYNLQVIAIIGLVGAYGVPFLLSDGSGRVVILFSYMCIINGGILVLAYKKYWKNLYYLAFFLSWLIFSVWWLEDYSASKHLATSLIFSTLFFAIFYATFLSYKQIRKEAIEPWSVVYMLVNSFVYFGFGYYSITDHPQGEMYLGLFTLFNAVFHFIACYIIFKSKDHQKDVFYFIAGLVLVFLTLSVPIQLDGSWVTLVWAGESALLFWLGRAKNFPVYEQLSLPLILFAFLSLLQDLDQFYNNADYSSIVPHHTLFLNIQFLSSLLVSLAFGFSLWLSLSKRFTSPFSRGSAASVAINFGLPAFLLLTVYFMFFHEVNSFWEQRFYASSIVIPGTADRNEYSQPDFDIRKFQVLWLINYSALFGLALSIISLQVIKNRILSFTSIGFNIVVLAAFLLKGLVVLGDLRASYLNQTDAQYYVRDLRNITIRYLSLVLALPLIWFNRQLLKHEYFNQYHRQVEKVLLHVFIIGLLSSELVHWLDMSQIENSDKLALSILWGVYALVLIVWGFKKNEKFIRILAIILFGITLIKLFVYDISDMSTIAKTIVMMTLGVLLLVASFLYNKVKKATDDGG